MMNDQHLSKKARRSLRRQGLLDETSASSTNSAKRWWGWIGGLVIAVLLVWGGISLSRGNSTTGNNPTVVLAAGDHLRGEAAAAVALLVYSDFQCPACQGQENLLNQVTDEYGDRLVYAFRNFPLESLHKNAKAAAQAAEAADLQSSFWAYHDLLFDRQSEWSSLSDPRDKFKDYAAELGLDAEKLATDSASDEVKNLVESDIASGNKLGLSWTPSIFINGTLVKKNPQNVDGLKKLIDDALPAVNN